MSRVWMRFEVKADGTLGPGSAVLYRAADGPGGIPDGLKLDVKATCSAPARRSLDRFAGGKGARPDRAARRSRQRRLGRRWQDLVHDGEETPFPDSLEHEREAAMLLVVAAYVVSGFGRTVAGIRESGVVNAVLELPRELNAAVEYVDGAVAAGYEEQTAYLRGRGDHLCRFATAGRTRPGTRCARLASRSSSGWRSCCRTCPSSSPRSSARSRSAPCRLRSAPRSRRRTAFLLADSRARAIVTTAALWARSVNGGPSCRSSATS